MNMKNKEIQRVKFSKTFLFTFPGEITFESASGYFNRLNDVDLGGDLFFDLSNTEEVHSSFIGFLINLKNNIENEGALSG